MTPALPAVVTIWMGVSLTLAPPLLAFSRGASPTSCLKMSPGHISTHPQEANHSHVTLRTSAASYRPGDLVTVTVRSSRDFMGFLLQARGAGLGPGGGAWQGGVAGSWLVNPAGTHTLSCQGAHDTLTHSDKRLKRNLLFVWKAPERPAGGVHFSLTIVQSYFIYWSGIESDTMHDGSRSSFGEASAHSKLQDEVFGKEQEDQQQHLATPGTSTRLKPQASASTPARPQLLPHTSAPNPGRPQLQPQASASTPGRPQPQPQASASTPGRPQPQPQASTSTPGRPQIQPQASTSTPGRPQIQPQASTSTPGSPQPQPQASTSTPGSPQLQPQASTSTPGRPQIQPQASTSTPGRPQIQPQASVPNTGRPPLEPQASVSNTGRPHLMSSPSQLQLQPVSSTPHPLLFTSSSANSSSSSSPPSTRLLPHPSPAFLNLSPAQRSPMKVAEVKPLDPSPATSTADLRPRPAHPEVRPLRVPAPAGPPGPVLRGPPSHPPSEGKLPGIEPRHSALELGLLLGCSASLGVVAVACLRYTYGQHCGRRTGVTLGEQGAAGRRGDGRRGLIHVQECGELVRVSRINRDNSLVLLAEYDVLPQPGN